jgi:hypothetical protein
MERTLNANMRRYDPRREHLVPYWSDGCPHDTDPVAAMRAKIQAAVEAVTGGNEIADERLYREWLMVQVKPRAMAASA